MTLIETLQRKRGYKEKLEEDYKSLRRSVRQNKRQYKRYISVRELFSSVAQSTQDNLVGYFENIGASMLKTIYGDEYKFTLSFKQQYNKNICILHVYKDDIELDLKDDVGVGIIDVLSFAMRLAIWSLSSPRTDNVFILDEPFKYVSVDKLPLVGEALHELSDTLNVQIIMVSHDEELIDIADAAYKVEISNKISSVERI